MTKKTPGSSPDASSEPLDVDRTGALIGVFNDLIRQTPDTLPLEDRVRFVLDKMPVEMVRELHEATRRLLVLAETRIQAAAKVSPEEFMARFDRDKSELQPGDKIKRRVGHDCYIEECEVCGFAQTSLTQQQMALPHVCTDSGLTVYRMAIYALGLPPQSLVYPITP